MFSAMPGGRFVILFVYLIVITVIASAVYLVLRLGVRDGLRSYQLWLERTNRVAPPRGRDTAD